MKKRKRYRRRKNAGKTDDRVKFDVWGERIIQFEPRGIFANNPDEARNLYIEMIDKQDLAVNGDVRHVYVGELK